MLQYLGEDLGSGIHTLSAYRIRKSSASAHLSRVSPVLKMRNNEENLRDTDGVESGIRFISHLKGV